MQIQSVTACYFSPTDTSRRGAMAVAEIFEQPVREVDLTPMADYAERTFGPEELVVLGAPVYGGRLPAVAAARLRTLRGSHTPCILTVTYGNRDYDDALLELYDLAVERGFVPVAAAALIGQHTFGHIAAGRPNADDIAEDRLFAARVRGRLAGWERLPERVPLAIKGNRPYKEGGKGGSFRPQTDPERCTGCGLCAKVCPVGAIDPQDVTKIDDSRCLSCFRCIRRCPAGAKNPHSEAYDAFVPGFNEKLATRRENEYILD